MRSSRSLALALAILLAVAGAALAGGRGCEPCQNIDGDLLPTSAWQTLAGSTTGQPGGEIAYSFPVLGGEVYTFSFCQEGGSADFDTNLSLQGPDACGPYIVCSEDVCDLNAELVWEAPADGTYIIVVDGFSVQEGEFTLAYRGASATPVLDSSWSTVKGDY
jgi:hypothetical protein